MAKRNELQVDKEKLKKLRVGMIFANIDDLCVFVGLPKSNRTGYQILMREYLLLNAGVEIEREGYRVIIKEINLK